MAGRYVDEKLLEYVRKGINRGYPVVTLRQQLAKEGWDIEEIDRAINSVEMGGKTSVNAPEKSMPKISERKPAPIKQSLPAAKGVAVLELMGSLLSFIGGILVLILGGVLMGLTGILTPFTGIFVEYNFYLLGVMGFIVGALGIICFALLWRMRKAGMLLGIGLGIAVLAEIGVIFWMNGFEARMLLDNIIFIGIWGVVTVYLVKSRRLFK